jgi:RNA polymerase sigma-70 factor (ECF subfamily)
MNKISQEPVVDVYNFIYNISYNMLECHHVSLDMAQSIYLKYLKKLEENPEMDENYKRFWLIRVVKNKCSNYVRDNKKFSSLDSLDSIDFTLAIDQSPNPQEALEQNEEKDCLYKKLRDNIAKLPIDQRKVLNLKYDQQLRCEEISKKTGFTVSKIKCVIHRAKTTLRKKMTR